jgi:NTE family protein
MKKQYNFSPVFVSGTWAAPRSGLIRGNRVLRYFRKWPSDKTFDDLRIPLYIVATDLISGDEVVFDHA